MDPNLYVSITGDDNNGNGSIDRPYKTLRKASEIAKPGSIINIRGGIYPRDIITPTGSGVDGNIITYRVYLNEAARFHSSDPGEAALVVYASNIIIEGIQIISSIHCGIILWNVNAVQIIRCTIDKCHRGGIYIGGTLNKINYSKIVVRNNTITNTCLVRSADFEEPSSPGAVVITKTDGAIIENNTIYNNYGEGIIFSNSINGLISQNTIYDNFNCGIYLDNCGHTLIERNYIYSTGKTKFFQNDVPMSGIIIGNEDRDLFINSDHIIIQNNIVTRYCYGILYDARGKSSGIHNCLIVNNTFYRGYREAVRIADSQTLSTNNEIVNNIFDHSKAYRPIDGIDKISMAGFKCHHNGWSHPPIHAGGPNDIISDARLLLLNRHYDFTDPAAQFKLKENSPMRDTGKYIPTIKTDFWGTPRTAPFCIGAHELNIDSMHYSAIMDSMFYKYPHHM
jgi:parallel beta-helix repeat protein